MDVNNISLNEYFNTTQKYYYFFDGLFNTIDENKIDILNSLNIPDSTYRTNRSKIIAKNSNHHILIDYFKCSKIEPIKQKQYENLIDKILYYIYYRKNNLLLEAREELIKYINENNYLKPLFTVIKLLIDINITRIYKDAVNQVNDELEYLKKFPKGYFTSPIYFILSIIKYYVGKKVDVEDLESQALLFPQFSWLYYFTRGSYSYYKNNDYEALIYYELAIAECNKDFNVDRMVILTNNICLLYNTLAKYEISFNYSSSKLKFLIYQYNDKNITSAIVMHYLFSCVMLNKYELILKFINIVSLDEEILMINSIAIIIYALYMQGVNIYLEYPKLIQYFENEKIKLVFDAIYKNKFPDLKNTKLKISIYLEKLLLKIKKDKNLED